MKGLHWITGYAMSGFLVWPALLLLSPIPLLDAVFLLAPMVIVPLGLGLTSDNFQNGKSRFLHRSACLIQPFAAGMLVISFLLPKGVIAGWFTAGWVLFTLICGLIGCIHLVEHRRNLSQLCVAAAYLNLPVGGFWLIFSRLGAQVLQFQEPIVLLTAIHFHYAGFATLILIHQANFFSAPDRSNLFRMAAAAAITGTPLLAIGFVISPWMKLFSVLLFTMGMICFCVHILMSKRHIENSIAHNFVRGSAVSIAATIVLALVYAQAEVSGFGWITISQMVLFHGFVNAFGFAAAGMIGWTLARIQA